MLDNGEPSTFDFAKAFPFTTETAYRDFKYINYPFELHGRADAVSNTVHANFNIWTSTTLDDLDERPEIVLFRALESDLTIQATLSYLAVKMCRVRKIEFPVDSTKMWDTCDVIITANPNILSAKPEGKISVKIERTYNNDSEADFTYATMEELMADKEGDFMKKLEQWKKEG